MIILDSSFIIDILRKHPRAIQKFENIKHNLISTTILNVYEITSGVYSIKDANYDNRIRILNEFLKSINILNLDLFSINKASKIKGDLTLKGQIIDDMDILISAMYLSNNCTSIITRNKKHFDRIKGLKVISY